MSNVKWIKLSTSMFDDEKIRLIEAMPDADSILIIWIKLLSQAGKTNASGYIYLSENIPYTDEMLATLFNRPISTVRLALKTFQDFGMIKVDENQFMVISNWEKHQNVASLDKIREDTRKRVQRHREKQKRLAEEKESNDTVTLRNALRKKKEEEEEEEEKDILSCKTIVSHLNAKTGKTFKHTTKATREKINARLKEGFTVDDFISVIDHKTDEWLNDKKMNKFLRPETLFGTKLESYLNEKKVRTNEKSIYANSKYQQ